MGEFGEADQDITQNCHASFRNDACSNAKSSIRAVQFENFIGHGAAAPLVSCHGAAGGQCTDYRDTLS